MFAAGLGSSAGGWGGGGCSVGNSGRMTCQNPIHLLPSVWLALPYPPSLDMFLCIVKVSEKLIILYSVLFLLSDHILSDDSALLSCSFRCGCVYNKVQAAASAWHSSLTLMNSFNN